MRSIIPGRIRTHLAFYAGLLVGGAVSLVIYILVFAAFLSGVLQALVAFGTLALAIATSYITVRDRGEALARELADRVYVPMRIKARGWSNPNSPPNVLPTWTQLTDTIPYLTLHVPSHIQKLFVSAEALERDTWTYTTPTILLINEYSKNATPGTNPKIFVRGASKDLPFLGEIDPARVWISGKTFDQYVTDFVKDRDPLSKGWHLELSADVPVPAGGTKPQRVGATKETIEFMADLFKLLESKSDSRNYREKYRELAEVGRAAYDEIEKQLRKPVAPTSSTPATVPGNPFG
jgi:hypothetical protein